MYPVQLSAIVFWRMLQLHSDTNLVVFGGATTAANTSLGCPGAPIDLLYLPLFFGEGGCGRPREKVALLLAGRTESLRGLMGGGGGWGSDTFGLRFLRLSSIVTYSSGALRSKRHRMSWNNKGRKFGTISLRHPKRSLLRQNLPQLRILPSAKKTTPCSDALIHPMTCHI